MPDVGAIVQSLPLSRRGLIPVRLAIEAAARRRSPRGRAGRIGGLVTARLYPSSRRPRDERGRFIRGVPAAPRPGAAAGRDVQLDRKEEPSHSPPVRAGPRPAGRATA
jgi:hypothetical protein